MISRLGRRVGGVLIPLLMVQAGCATVVSGSDQEVDIRSNPPGATALIWRSLQIDRGLPSEITVTAEGEPVAIVVTPGSAKLERKYDHVMRLEKVGFSSVDVGICRTWWGNSWVLGNIVLLPALIPMLIANMIDGMTGAASELGKVDPVVLAALSESDSVGLPLGPPAVSAPAGDDNPATAICRPKDG